MKTKTEKFDFEGKKIKYGWVLNIYKMSEDIIATSLYNNFNQLMEIKAFELTNQNDLELFKKYVGLFEEHPENNYFEMSQIKA